MKTQDWVVIQGWFYVSNRCHKSVQLKMITRMEWLINYGFDYNLLFEGSKTNCKKFMKSQKS